MAETRGPMMHHGDQAVTRQRVGQLERMTKFPRGIRHQRGRPCRARIEIFAPQFGKRGRIRTTTDEESLVVKILRFEVFRNE